MPLKFAQFMSIHRAGGGNPPIKMERDYLFASPRQTTPKASKCTDMHVKFQKKFIPGIAPDAWDAALPRRRPLLCLVHTGEKMSPGNKMSPAV